MQSLKCLIHHGLFHMFFLFCLCKYVIVRSVWKLMSRVFSCELQRFTDAVPKLNFWNNASPSLVSYGFKCKNILCVIGTLRKPAFNCQQIPAKNHILQRWICNHFWHFTPLILSSWQATLTWWVWGGAICLFDHLLFLPCDGLFRCLWSAIWRSLKEI